MAGLMNAAAPRALTRVVVSAAVGFLMSAAGSTAFADDGSWSALWSVQNGPIYSETENPDVSLDRELLDFSRNGGVITAVFQFRNLSSRPVKVDAGFPVIVHLPVGSAPVLDGGGDDTSGASSERGDTTFFLPLSRYGGDEALAGWQYAEPVLTAGLRTADGSDGIDPSMLEEYDMSDQYFKLSDVIPRVSAVPKELPFDIRITQDGGVVPIDLVVMEAQVPGGASGSELVVTYHFKHTLTFAAGATSTVKVRYAGFDLSTVDMGGYSTFTRYSADYVLGTGATWNGPIGLLVVTADDSIDLQLPTALRSSGTWRGKTVAVARRYEPAATDRIDAAFSDASPVWMNTDEEIAAPTVPVDPKVKGVRASSFLDDPAPSFRPEGVVRDATYRPTSLFDGMDETSWVEGAPGDGIGEWVEFQITGAASGIDVTNGYVRTAAPVPGHDYETAFERNGRVRTLEIATPQGRSISMVNLDDSPDPQRIMVDLPAGTYRAIIRSVYPGSRYHDTCLAEIRFLWSSPDAERLLAAEPFIKSNWVN